MGIKGAAQSARALADNLERGKAALDGMAASSDRVDLSKAADDADRIAVASDPLGGMVLDASEQPVSGGMTKGGRQVLGQARGGEGLHESNRAFANRQRHQGVTRGGTAGGGKRVSRESSSNSWDQERYHDALRAMGMPEDEAHLRAVEELVVTGATPLIPWQVEAAAQRWAEEIGRRTTIGPGAEGGTGGGGTIGEGPGLAPAPIPIAGMGGWTPPGASGGGTTPPPPPPSGNGGGAGSVGGGGYSKSADIVTRGEAEVIRRLDQLIAVVSQPTGPSAGTARRMSR